MMKSEDAAKGKQSCGSRLRDDVSKIYDCFVIVNRPDPPQKTDVKPEYKYPENFNDEEILQQTYLFCFPFAANANITTFRDHANHFTFILTDIEGKHRFGFCKLTNEGKKCYCILSFLPWFEIFYKILNYTHELAIKGDEETLEIILLEMHQQPIPAPNERLHFSPTLTFPTPDHHDLPSIPENINLSEYYAAVNIIFMMEVFASLMFERRIIFTAKSLSVLTSCIHSAESLLNPLHWQHIFIPVMPPHLLDYCLAPMPYLVGVHSSLMPKVRDMVAMDDDVIIADIDKEEILSVHNDSERIPNDSMSFLKSLLRKPDVRMGRGLALAFLRTQARLIGGYRRGLKFKQGEPIVFDEERFVESYRSNTTREFARSLVQLQTFKQFVDGRLDMLNSGVGFRDEFENEVNFVDAMSSKEGDTYKEWLVAAKKGGNKLFIQMQKMAKENMKSAQNYLKQQQIKLQESGINRQKSLDQSTQRIRPSRPPPIDPEKLADLNTRVYTELNLDNLEEASTSDPPNSAIHPSGAERRERSESDVSFQGVNVDLMSDMTQVLDQKLVEITSPTSEAEDVDLLTNHPNNLPSSVAEIVSVATPDLSESLVDVTSSSNAINKHRSSSEIRRRSLVTSRPNALKQKTRDQSSSSGESIDIENDYTFPPIDQLIELAPSPTEPEAAITLTSTADQSTTANDLLSLDFSSFGTTQSTAAADVINQEENWADFKSDPTPELSNAFNPFAPSVPRESSRTQSSAFPHLAGSNPFLPGQVSSNSSRTSSPSRTPHRLSPEKLNPFKVSQGGTTQPYHCQQTFPSYSGQMNSFANTSVNTATAQLRKTNSSQSLPVRNNQFLSPQHRSVTGLNKTSPVRQTQANKDNELFSDLLGSWKTREGL